MYVTTEQTEFEVCTKYCLRYLRPRKINMRKHRLRFSKLLLKTSKKKPEDYIVERLPLYPSMGFFTKLAEKLHFVFA